MPIRWSWTTIPLLLSGCTPALAPDPPLDPDPPAPAADPDDFHGPRPLEPPDPCATPVSYQTHGFLVLAPLPCVRLYRDKGDPPPRPPDERLDRVDPPTPANPAAPPSRRR